MAKIKAAAVFLLLNSAALPGFTASCSGRKILRLTLSLKQCGFYITNAIFKSLHKAVEQ